MFHGNIRTALSSAAHGAQNSVRVGIGFDRNPLLAIIHGDGLPRPDLTNDGRTGELHGLRVGNTGPAGKGFGRSRLADAGLAGGWGAGRAALARGQRYDGERKRSGDKHFRVRHESTSFLNIGRNPYSMMVTRSTSKSTSLTRWVSTSPTRRTRVVSATG